MPKKKSYTTLGRANAAMKRAGVSELRAWVGGQKYLLRRETVGLTARPADCTPDWYVPLSER